MSNNGVYISFNCNTSGNNGHVPFGHGMLFDVVHVSFELQISGNDGHVSFDFGMSGHWRCVTLVDGARSYEVFWRVSVLMAS